MNVGLGIELVSIYSINAKNIILFKIKQHNFTFRSMLDTKMSNHNNSSQVT